MEIRKILGGLMLMLIISGLRAQMGPEYKPVWKINEQANLDTIAEKCYGHRSYARMIVAYNRVVTNAVPVGRIIYTPKVYTLFKKTGLIPKYEPEFKLIYSVISGFRKIVPAYIGFQEKAAKALEGNRRVSIPKRLQIRLISLYKKLDDAIAGIIKKREKAAIPRNMLKKLKNAAAEIRYCSTGKAGRNYSKDLDQLEQDFARGLANAVHWSRELRGD